jgi:hypothetical protein
MSPAIRSLTGRPLPVQAPTAFVRIRPRSHSQASCGMSKPGRYRCAGTRRLTR